MIRNALQPLALDVVRFEAAFGGDDLVDFAATLCSGNRKIERNVKEFILDKTDNKKNQTES